MPPSSEEFVANLVRSGLLSADETAAFFAQLPRDRQPKDARALARALVRAGKLTKFQASLVYRGRIKGLVMGEYTLLDRIGAGGMGDVYKARHRTMDRTVALKTLTLKATASSRSVARFHREVRVAAKLMHPNIVTALDAGEQEGVHFLVMEYVDGEALSKRVREQGPMPVELAVDCIIQAARGLEYAHSQGVIHRDVKPGNLLIDKAGTVKILDMGLALMGADAPGRPGERLTGSNQALGTCDYMAPEQAEDTRTVDHRVDIYSLGCTLYQLLTGEPPYVRESLIKVLVAHREAPIPSLIEARPDVPSALDAVFARLMAKRPDDRYQTMTEVIAELEGCLHRKEPIEAVPADGPADEALESFFQVVQQTEVAARQKTKAGHEETLDTEEERDTHPSGGNGVLRKPGRSKALVAGLGVIVIALAAVLAVIYGPWGTGPPGPPRPGGAPPWTEPSPPAAPPRLLIQWSQDQRQGAILEIDGQGQDLARWISSENPDQVQVSLEPGEHRLLIVRPGFQPFERRFVLPENEDFVVEPDWEPIGP